MIEFVTSMLCCIAALYCTLATTLLFAFPLSTGGALSLSSRDAPSMQRRRAGWRPEDRGPVDLRNSVRSTDYYFDIALALLECHPDANRLV